MISLCRRFSHDPKQMLRNPSFTTGDSPRRRPRISAVITARDSGLVTIRPIQSSFIRSASARACFMPFSLRGKSTQPRMRRSLFPAHSPCLMKYIVVFADIASSLPVHPRRFGCRPGSYHNGFRLQSFSELPPSVTCSACCARRYDDILLKYIITMVFIILQISTGIPGAALEEQQRESIRRLGPSGKNRDRLLICRRSRFLFTGLMKL